MKINEFKNLLQDNRNKQFQLQLPDASTVPVSFHITEVGYITKTFIDCGGKVHTLKTCQLQAWVGDDIDHRIEAGKMADILIKAESLFYGTDFLNLDVEIEYEGALISQYPVAEAIVSDEAVTLRLTTKHTDCLAKEICLLPLSGGDCGSSGCC
jgi:hypothetical protein